jgi:hypothetical protein
VLQEPGHVGDRENPVPPGAAEALEPADQVAGGNMPRDGLPVQGHQGGELGHADGGAAGKGGLERGAQLGGIARQRRHGRASS